jgi:hypothetical protein
MTVTFQTPTVLPPFDGVKYVAPPMSETGCGGKLFEVRQFNIDASNSARVILLLSDSRPAILAFDQLEVDLRRDITPEDDAPWNDYGVPVSTTPEPINPTSPTAPGPAPPPSGMSCNSYMDAHKDLFLSCRSMSKAISSLLESTASTWPTNNMTAICGGTCLAQTSYSVLRQASQLGQLNQNKSAHLTCFHALYMQ